MILFTPKIGKIAKFYHELFFCLLNPCQILPAGQSILLCDICSMNSNQRNIAVLAHADAGKTTLTAQFLFLSGQTRQAGSVDHGTAETDDLPVEKERGISVRSSHTSFLWKDIRINLVDTPGHVDFSADVGRILSVCDGAILVLSAVEGVQAHTRTLWEALRRRNIPVIFFINKIDRVGADVDSVCKGIEKDLKAPLLRMQEVDAEKLSLSMSWPPESDSGPLTEQVIALDDYLLEAFLDGHLPSSAELEASLIRQIHQCHIFPLYAGVAKSGFGVEELLDAVVKYLPGPSGKPADPLSALVFGISFDARIGRIAHVRLFGGRMANRDVVFNATRGTDEKINRILRLLPGKYEDIGEAEAGDIAGISGLTSARIGDVLGLQAETSAGIIQLQTPLIMARVRPLEDRDYAALAAAVTELSEEDPALGLDWNREEQEILVNVMGWIQMEVLERILADRFGISARFENPTVIYRETPLTTATGFVQYWMPKPCWAVMTFLIEPGERGSGVVYQSRVPVNSIQQKYQNEVERTIPEALKQGIKGWEVTDIRISLVEGEDHVLHSRPGDFVIAMPMGIMDGLRNAGTQLLEPMIRFDIEAAEELLGPVTSDITRMRGSFESPEIEDGIFRLSGIVPLASSLDYPVKLSSRSGGKARISTRFDSYRECPDELGVIRPYRGISPLDTAKYILKARGAITSGG